MASAYSKRLAKLEELLASKVNRPLAYLWLNDGETREECCIRAGYDPSQIDRIRFCRWLDPALDEIRPEYAWDQVNEPGPYGAKPTDGVTQMSPHPGAGQTVTGVAQRSEAGATPSRPRTRFRG